MRDTYYISLSIYRVYLAFHIFKKYLFYFFEKELVYGVNSFYDFHPDPIFAYLNIKTDIFYQNINFILTTVLILCVLYGFGIGKNLTCVFLFFTVEILQRLNGIVLNGGDNLLKFILLYMCFANSFKFLTLAQSNQSIIKEHNLLTKLSLLSIKIHLCLVYFISAIFKINTKMWFAGIANYYILNLERFMGTKYNTILSQSTFFVTLSTYFTLFWELSFPFLVWFKKVKLPFLILGVLLHLGIYVFMMIHDFEILFIATYILFFNDKELKKIKNFTITKILKRNVPERLHN